MSYTAVLRELMAAGLAGEALAEAMERIEQAEMSTRHPPDNAIEKRRAWDREYRRKTRSVHPTSTRNPPDPPDMSENALSIKKDLKKEKRERGTRCPPDWTPSSDDLAFVEAQGFPRSEIDREAQKFRDYWIGKPGAAGIKNDWPATWRNWIRRVCEQRGIAPPQPTGPPASGWRPGLPTDAELRAKYANGKTDGPSVVEGRDSEISAGELVRDPARH